MSLQVWLPLNGSLENKGLSDIVATNNGATIDTNGKIGACYSFDGSDDYILLQGNILNEFVTDLNEFSICCWVYKKDSTRGIIIGDYGLSGSGLFNFEFTAANKLRFYWTSSYDKTFPSVVSTNSWNHICVTYKTGKLKLYINGINSNNDIFNITLPASAKTSNIFYLGRDYRTGATVINGNINDFRLYNHCLSVKEVKEISKGLILHYKLDDPYIGPINLLSKEFDCEELTTYNISELTPYYGYCFYNYYTEHSSEDNDYYTFSAYIKNNTDTNVLLRLRGSTTTIKDSIILPSGEEGWLTVTGDYNTVSTATYVLCAYVFGKSGPNVVGNIQVYHAKLEHTSEATPWTESGVEKNNIIYDSSGYEYNSNIKNELTISSDTPKYSLSTHFVDGSYLISPWTILGVIPSDALTASIWVKYDSTPPSHHWAIFSCTQSSGFRFAATGDKLQFWVYCANVGYRTATSTVSMSSLIGSWHMLTGTCDRQNVKLYLDNDTEPIATIAWDSTNLIGLATTVPLVIGGEAKGSTTQAEYSDFTGSLSDARIYATALSSEDILELYRAGASIDNKGNIYARELIEETKPSITKSGLFINSEIKELETASILKQLSTGNYLYEI